jgi:hypothetical protein
MFDRRQFGQNRNHHAQLWSAAWVACALSLWIGCANEPSKAERASSTDDESGDEDSDSSPTSETDGTGAAETGTRGGAADAGKRVDAGRGASDPGTQRDAGGGAKDSGAGDVTGPATDSGAADSGSAGGTSAFKRGCKDLDPGPCASFQPGGPYGAKEMELGPYGASLDYNTGKDFEYPVASGDADNDFTCGLLSGGQTSMMPTGGQQVDYAAFSVYRPGAWREGEKLPIIVWGNGTCAWPEAYGALLRYVASHGFVIFAPNSRWVGDAVALKKGLDFAFAANDDSKSPYYQRLDTTKVGAMGHSQGSSGTANVASDARVKAVILWNGGTSATKPFLAVSGDGDIGDVTPASYRSGLEGARTKGAWLFYHMILQMSDVPGHLTLVTQPARVVEPAVAWWKYILHGDADSKSYFVGPDCKLCNGKDEFEFGQKDLE